MEDKTTLSNEAFESIKRGLQDALEGSFVEVKGPERMSRQTKIINLWGGPGCGKSTTAAELFAELKYRGLSTELVREEAKNLAWEGRAIDEVGQICLFAEQLRREALLWGKVDYLITDCPIELSCYYSSGLKIEGLYKAYTCAKQAAIRRGVNLYNYHFLLKRNKPFVCAGRFHGEEEARRVDEELREKLITGRCTSAPLYTRGYGAPSINPADDVKVSMTNGAASLHFLDCQDRERIEEIISVIGKRY